MQIPRLLQPATRRGLPRAIALGMSATAIVLLVNLALLIYATQQPSTTLGTRILFQGDCNDTATRSTVAHLAINILGTLVLAASNAAMQCLIAPTRESVDRAHAQGRWLEVGIASLRNVWHAGIIRQVLWTGLLVTSLPLHLFYNSVFIQTSSASEYYAVVATQDFATGAPFSTDAYVGVASAYNTTDHAIIEQIQQDAPTYTRLSFDDCMAAYNTPFVKSRTNVVLVSNITSYNNSATKSSVLLSTFFSPSDQGFNYSLFYPTDNTDPDSYIYSPYIKNGMLPYLQPETYVDIPSRETDMVQIESCLSQEVAGSCRVEFYVPFMAVVIVCNVLKLACLAVLWYGFPSMTPFVTIGDAIASFLARPDPHTEGGYAVKRKYVEGRAHEVRDEVVAHGALPYFITRWKGHRHLRKTGLGLQQAIQTYTTGGVWIIGGAVLIHQILAPGNDGDENSISLAQLWANGFGNPYPESIVTSTLSSGVAANIILANIPQLVLSIFYVVYNQDLTALCITAEMAAFSTSRKYLRVTTPSGQQRSTFWLGLPYRYCIPLLGLSAVMHWAASEGIFLSEISVVDPSGHIIEAMHINAVGYSVIGISIMYGTGWILILGSLVARLWPLPNSMPVMGACSLAISAACHGQSVRSVDATSPLKYGATEVVGEKAARVGFSDGEVEPLQPGWNYNGTRLGVTKGNGNEDVTKS